MILESKLSFQSHVREAIIKARKGIGIIHFLSKYVSWDVLDQIYKLYGDRILNVVDADPMNLSSTDLCNLLLYGNSCFSVDTNHHIIESTISQHRVSSGSRQIIKQIVTTFDDSGYFPYSFTFLYSFFLHVFFQSTSLL